MWHKCQDSPIISLWETTCKIHADSKHDEMKGIIREQNRFNSSNWTHSAILILVGMLSLILVAGCCFICYRFVPIIMFAKKLKKMNQMIPQHQHQHQHHQHQHQQPYNLSLNAPPFSGRTLQFKEILSDQ